MPYKDKKKRNEYAREYYRKHSKKGIEYSINYYNSNKEVIKKKKVFHNAKYRREARKECIDYYSKGKNNCECCGESNVEFLCIDHIGGGGGKHRKEISARYGTISVFLKRNNFPKGYRILCHNCNMSRGFYGYCPHQIERGEVEIPNEHRAKL